MGSILNAENLIKDGCDCDGTSGCRDEVTAGCSMTMGQSRHSGSIFATLLAALSATFIARRRRIAKK